MNRVVQWLAATLTADERNAVLGDLAEANARPAEMIRDLSGLVLRRQAALWKHWRSWVALVAVAAPLGLMLSIQAGRNAHTNAIFLWLYLNNWDTGMLELRAFRLELLKTTSDLIVSWIGLALWSWAAGRALAAASPETRHVSAAVFAMLLFSQFSLTGPTGGTHGANDAVFTLAFYRVVYPLLVKTLLVMMPCWFALRRRIA